MTGGALRGAVWAVLFSVGLYRLLLSDSVATLGIGRKVQPITDFAYQCRRIGSETIQACEDMWLDETSRQLYLACSNTASRQHWFPNMDRYNASGRHMKDSIVVLDIDKPHGNSFEQRVLSPTGFYGTAGEGALHVLSVSGRKVSDTSKTHLYLVNNKPAVSTDATMIDDEQALTNATVELFEIEPGSSSMRHIQTFSHRLIATPNNVAVLPDGSGFFVSNDHGLHTTGLQRQLSPLLFTGTVTFCNTPTSSSNRQSPTKENSDPSSSSQAGLPQTDCHTAATGLSFPNGLTIHPTDPGHLYVPSALLGVGVTIYTIPPSFPRPHRGVPPSLPLKSKHHLNVPYPIDNLSPSSDGSIYAAAFPKALEFLSAVAHPDSYQGRDKADLKTPPSKVIRIDKSKNLVAEVGKEVSWTWEGVLEDRDGSVLPGSTSAVFDVKTGRLFMGGAISQFITVCEPLSPTPDTHE